MGSPARRTLVAELARYDRLLEVGIGGRPETARSLAERGRDVIAVDVDPGATEAGGSVVDETEGSVRLRRGDVVALADAADPAAALGAPATDGIDAVYGLRLPAELQRPTAALAGRLGAACAFTTLGFEEPVVPVERRSLRDATLYVARGPTGVARDERS